MSESESIEKTNLTESLLTKKMKNSLKQLSSCESLESFMTVINQLKSYVDDYYFIDPLKASKLLERILKIEVMSCQIYSQ